MRVNSFKPPRWGLFFYFLLITLLTIAAENTENPVQLPEVVISADAPRSIENTVEKEDLESMAVPELTDALEQKLNLSLNQYGSYGSLYSLSTGGFRGDRIGIVLNGTPLRASQGGAFDLSLIPFSYLQSMDFTQRDESALMGGTLGMSSVSEKPKAEITLGVRNISYLDSPLDGQGLYWNWRAQPKDWQLHLGNEFHYAQNRFSYSYEGEEFQRTDSLVQDGSLFLTLSKKKRDKSFHFSSLGVFASKEVPGPHNGTSGKQEDLWGRLSLGYESSYTDTAFSIDHHRLTWEQSTKDIHGITQGYGSLKQRWYMSYWGELSLKGQLMADFIDSTTLDKQTSWDVIGSSEILLAPSESWNLNTAVDLRYYQEQVLTAPSLYLEGNPGNWITQVYANRGLKPPSFNDRFWPEDGFAQGNPDLKMEDAWTLGGKLGFYFTQGQAALESSYSEIYNQIRWLPRTGGIWIPSNEDKVRLFNLGVDLRSKLPFGNKIDGNIRYTTNTLTDGNQSPLIPWLTAKAGLENQKLLDCVGINLRYEGKRYLTDLNLYTLDPIILIDIYLTQEILKGQHLSIRMDNLLNKTYYQYDGYPLPGISLKVEWKTTYSFKKDQQP